MEKNKRKKLNGVKADVMGSILGVDRMRVICSDCQNKYKRVPLVTNDLGFKTCKHITHTQYAYGMNVWR